MTTNETILYASLVGDALSLGTHWIYSQREIAENAGAIEDYIDPLSTYHPGKKAGDFTHYGDQTLVLLQSIAKAGRFDLDVFAEDWRAFWEDSATDSYCDGATKETLQNLAAGRPPSGAASGSNDISGAARIAPLFLLPWESEEDLLEAARRQAGFTHGDPAVVEAAEFFSRVVLDIRNGSPVDEALASVASLDHWRAIPGEWFEAAKNSGASNETDSASAKQHGLTCHIPEAFPVICHLLIRHPDDLVLALTANAGAGGDTAARGMILGMIHGARPDASALPEKWLAGLRAKDIIREHLEQIPAHA